MELAARSLKIDLEWLDVGASYIGMDQGASLSRTQITRRFRSAVWGGADAFIVLPEIEPSQNTAIVELARKYRLPGIFWASTFVEMGGLMSYGANSIEQSRRAAYMVDKILKGAKPADLPVERPTQFELVINLKTAKEIGVTIHPEVLMWADRVIK